MTILIRSSVEYDLMLSFICNIVSGEKKDICCRSPISSIRAPTIDSASNASRGTMFFSSTNDCVCLGDSGEDRGWCAGWRYVAPT
jgi:hypothetical protein